METWTIPACWTGWRIGRADRLLHVHEIPARPARTAPWPDWVPRRGRRRLRGARASTCRGSTRRRRCAAAAAGHHVALATGTASGKSLAFGMVALSRIRSRHVRARTAAARPCSTCRRRRRSPTTSCGRSRGSALPWLRAATYDGDTPQDERAWVRQHANYVLTNPDLLHHSMLPGHSAWSSFLKRLDVIVIDEAHAYRGVFGAHVSAVVRRLRRVCAHYGSQPRRVHRLRHDCQPRAGRRSG